MAQALSIRQTQRQAISPAMMTELSLLQLPIGELAAAVKKELASNPALEPERPFSGGRSLGPSGAGSEGVDALENVADVRGETLDEHLLGELRMAGVTGRDLALAEAIVEGLDERGYFTGTYADLIMVLDGSGVRGVAVSELEQMRQRILAIDPRGCGARDLAECYRAQLGAVPAAMRPAAERAVDELAAAIREDRLDSFRPSDLRAFRALRSLDPFPGRLYDRRKTDFVAPDIFVDEEGEVRVDSGDVPEVRVSPKYVEMAKDRELDAETRAYAADRVRRAREFREALVRRRETMETIAECTFARQGDYLAKGPSGLLRLTMSEIAKAAKCTVSTVSRAAARKYVKTPRGTVPFRRFFVLVDQAPVERLRALLSELTADAPISDRALSERLKAEGITMARRTVAKYRARLGFTRPKKGK